jgi:hypothetical protein
MSTKTSTKRIALVAVSALGFGLLSVMPAKAAPSATNTNQSGSVTLDTATTTYAGRVGQQVSIDITGDIAANTTDNSAAHIPSLSIAAAITSQPASSTVYPTLVGVAGFGNDDAGAGSTLTELGTGLIFDDVNTATSITSAGSATAVATLNYAGDTADQDVTVHSNKTLGSVRFTPTVAGVYTVVVWNEKDRTVNAYADAGGGDIQAAAATQAALSGSESYQTFTINDSCYLSN